MTETITTAATRLQAFVREHAPGTCRILSEGQNCQCLLCDVSRLAGLALEADNREAREMAAEIERLKAENTKLIDGLNEIDKTLQIPAAEYVPAISDVFTIIDKLNLQPTAKIVESEA